MSLHKQTVLIVIGLLLVVAIAAYSNRPDNSQFILRIYPKVNDVPFVAGSEQYANPGGEGNFMFRDVRFFISNIELIGTRSRYKVPDSYHLVNLTGDGSAVEITLTDLPDMQVSAVQLGIGIDPQSNGKLMIAGDLDPNSRMAWSWDVGYKFILLEGMLRLQDSQKPLVYHVGFSENYTTVTLPVQQNSRTLSLDADILKLFTGRQPVDMAALPSVKFDREDARRIAAGFGEFLSVCNEDCAQPTP